MTHEPPEKPPVKGKRPAGPGRGNKVKVGPWAGSGIPAGGPGYGGDAKGEGSGPAALIPGGHTREAIRLKREDEQAVAEEMRGILLDVARNSDYDALKIAAADKLLNRIEGAPLQRSISAHLDDVSRLTDDELAAELAKAGRR